MSPKILRRCLLLLAVALPALAASPASADVPEGWADRPEDVNALHALLVLGAIPLGLFLLIALAVYLPAMVRGERVAPGHHAELEGQWFGGPRQGTHELESAPADRSTESGGGSGTW